MFGINSGGIKCNQPFSRCWTGPHVPSGGGLAPSRLFSQSTSLFLKMASRRVISGRRLARSHLALVHADTHEKRGAVPPRPPLVHDPPAVSRATPTTHKLRLSCPSEDEAEPTSCFILVLSQDKHGGIVNYDSGLVGAFIKNSKTRPIPPSLTQFPTKGVTPRQRFMQPMM